MHTEQTCSLAGYSGRRTTARVTIATFDRAARLRRALKGLALAWAAALGAVFIPVAHFVLVPSLALFGVVTFARRLGAEQVAVAARGTCPDCGAEQELDVLGRWSLPRTVSCRACQRALTLDRA